MLLSARELAVRWLLEPVGKAEGLTISLSKINSKSEYLSDAVLELYAVDNTNADKLNVTGGTIDYVYTGSNNSYIRIKTSGAVVTVSGLLPGRYSLSEVTAPNGYVNNIGSYYFVIADNAVKPMGTSQYYSVDGTAFKIINNRKRQIRFVVCHINGLPYPTEYSVNETYHHTYNEEQIVYHDDTITRKNEGMQAVKIYDDDAYIGVAAIFTVQSLPQNRIDGKNSNYIDVISNVGFVYVSGGGDEHGIRLYDGSQTYTLHTYTNMTESSKFTQDDYANQSCPFTPRPAMNHYYGPDEEGYHSDIADTMGVRNTVINSVYKSGGSIAVSSTLSIVITDTCVNLRKVDGERQYDWLDVEKTYTYTRSEKQTNYINLNPANYPNISDYVSSTDKILEYMYYGDGLTEEKMTEYYSLFKKGSTWNTDIVVDFED